MSIFRIESIPNNVYHIFVEIGKIDSGILTTWFKDPVRTISPNVKSSSAWVTLNVMCKSWVPCGAIVNQDGSILTVTPFGGNTALRYVSALLSTFVTARCTIRDPLRDVIVIEGKFRSDGFSNNWPQIPPVAVLTILESMFGSEQRKLM